MNKHDHVMTQEEYDSVESIDWHLRRNRGLLSMDSLDESYRKVVERCVQEDEAKRVKLYGS